ncbi:MAG: thioredoxin family protein [Saprospiraceae bacterium]|nr:thioredoxin family protein [Saprospiraceae bacterium]
MAYTESKMLELGIKAPSFTLNDILTGEPIHFPNAQSHVASLIIFMCNHCPYVIHVLAELDRLTKEYAGKGVRIIGINSNDVSKYPADSPENMAKLALEYQFIFPYCYDESQEVARSFDAACTPEFYVFDQNSMLQYRGRMDESRPGNQIPVTGSDLRDALDCVIDQTPVSKIQYPSGGCNIKWRVRE